MTQLSRERLVRIIESANGVLTALAGTNDDVSPNDSRALCKLWDYLNDAAAPPEVVKELAEFTLSALEAAPVAWIVGERLFNTLLAAGQYASEMRMTVQPLYSIPRPVVTERDLSHPIDPQIAEYEKIMDAACSPQACRASDE